MPSVMEADEKTHAMERAYQRAGFRVERIGKSTVFERELPESVKEATRALINGHGKASRNSGASQPEGALGESHEK